MPDFSHLPPPSGYPPINNFKPNSDPPTLTNPLQEIQKNKGPDYVNKELGNVEPGA